MTDEEAAKKLNVARRTVWKWIHHGRLKATLVEPSRFLGYTPYSGVMGMSSIPSFSAPSYSITLEDWQAFVDKYC